MDAEPTEGGASSAAYNLVIVGGTAGAVSVAISSQRSGLGNVRIVESGSAVALPALVGAEQLDIGYGEPVTAIDVAAVAVGTGPDPAPADGTHLVVATPKQTYTTRAVMIAERPPVVDWAPTMVVPDSDRIHVGNLPR